MSNFYIREAFQYHRRHGLRASVAFQRANQDRRAYLAALEAGDTREASRFVRFAPDRQSNGLPWPMFGGSPADKVRALLGDDGLRHAGDAHDFGIDHTGWFDNEDGESSRDGDGKVWGVVYRLPHGKCVPGHKFGGHGGGPVLDFGSICDTPEDAARIADGMAENAADEEREYQTAWRAGTDYREALDALAAGRRDALALIKARKAALASETGLDVAILTAHALASVRAILAKRCALRANMAELADVPKALRSAFCDGASLNRFPGA